MGKLLSVLSALISWKDLSMDLHPRKLRLLQNNSQVSSDLIGMPCNSCEALLMHDHGWIIRRYIIQHRRKPRPFFATHSSPISMPCRQIFRIPHRKTRSCLLPRISRRIKERQKTRKSNNKGQKLRPQQLFNHTPNNRRQRCAKPPS